MDIEKQTKRIYVDNSAATPVDERVLLAMEPYWRDVMGNPGSIHREGQIAKSAVEKARATVAGIIHARKEQVVFTSGGTESNSLAIQGIIRTVLSCGRPASKTHVLVSEIEHDSVLKHCASLIREGLRVDMLQVDCSGHVLTHELRDAISEDTVLVSLVHVNNEIGTIQDVEDIGKVIRHARKKNGSIYPLLHYDACQSPTWTPLHVERMSADTMTLDSQKCYGPKGVGCLFVRDSTLVTPIVSVASQEYGLRPGTPPVPLIVGFTEALSLVEEERDKYVSTVEGLRKCLIDTVLENVPNALHNGTNGDRAAAGIISLSFEGVESEQLVIELDARGIAASAGSACVSDFSNGSHVIRAVQKGRDTKRYGTVRFSLSRYTTEEEITFVSKALIETVHRLRENAS